MKRTISIVAIVALLTGCGTLTPMQKRIVTAVAVGTAIAMIKANDKGGSAAVVPNYGPPCGCTPPPMVK